MLYPSSIHSPINALSFLCISILAIITVVGQAYGGFENDVWAMGITLYSMLYTENAFFDVQETLTGTLHPPFEASAGKS